MDEPTLLDALADDLDLAFEGLVRARQDRLFSIALRIVGDRSEAEDAAQEAFIRAYRSLGGWESTRIRELHLDAWLATIVVNVARTRSRRRRTTSARESLTFIDELDHPTGPSAETPHGSLARREESEAWAVRLLALPERFRAPIVLRHVDGLGYAEIGEALDRPAGTVKAQVHRGLALLRAALEAESRTQPPADPEPAAPGRTTTPSINPFPRLQEVPR
ncbi:MAG: sigma-70 family RNA polymerase sigma factor [Chloroflexota bacterium]|nr:sigma-70 family RNA polymerase sigma factor [Chloroflexota bacterium]